MSPELAVRGVLLLLGLLLVLSHRDAAGGREGRPARKFSWIFLSTPGRYFIMSPVSRAIFATFLYFGIRRYFEGSGRRP